MNCPRCGLALVDVTPDLDLAHVRGLGCERCQGHWLEEAGLKELETMVHVSWVEVRHLPSDEAQRAPLNCPRCSPTRELAKRRSTRDTHVVMDVCASCHGVWLDGGELEAIQEKGALASALEAVRFVLGA